MWGTHPLLAESGCLHDSWPAIDARRCASCRPAARLPKTLPVSRCEVCEVGSLNSRIVLLFSVETIRHRNPDRSLTARKISTGRSSGVIWLHSVRETARWITFFNPYVAGQEYLSRPLRRHWRPPAVLSDRSQNCRRKSWRTVSCGRSRSGGNSRVITFKR